MEDAGKYGGLAEKKDREVENLSTARARVINAIMTEGLLSARSLHEQGRRYYGSFDATPYHACNGCVINNSHETITWALYSRSVIGSILQVIMERPGERLSGIKPDNYLQGWLRKVKHGRIYEERLRASFLVVTKSGGGIGFASRLSVPIGEIEYFVLPQNIWAEYEKTNALMRARNLNIPVKTVPGFINRTVAGIPSLKIPDYEGALKQIFQKEKGLLWVHGVRLPTEEDIT